MGANTGTRVDIRPPKRLAALCFSTVSVSANLPMSCFQRGLPARRTFRGAHPLSHRRMLIHVDILRPESLEGLWFATVRVPAWLVGNVGSGVDNRLCGHSKPCVFQR